MKIVDISKCSDDVLIYFNGLIDKYGELEKSNRKLTKEIERLNKENEELKHKLKLINSYVYGCNIDSLGSDKE